MVDFTIKCNHSQMHIHDFQEVYTISFQSWLTQKIQHTTKYFQDDATQAIIDYLNIFTEKGKRFRPYMVYLGYTMYGGQDDEFILRVGHIHELIHIFALIHDDICDQGMMRRHVPTYHKHLASYYNHEHVGISQALLVGDLVYTRAMQEICTVVGSTPSVQQNILTMMEEVVCGEILDVHFSHEVKQRTAAEIVSKDDLKSGQYTFEKPLLSGALLADIPEKEYALLSSFGKQVGGAFQMRDDLLDWLPNNEGKTPYSDIQEGNQTVVTRLLLDEANDDEVAHILACKGTHCSVQDIERLAHIFSTYAIATKIAKKIDTHLDIAEQQLDGLMIASTHKQLMHEIIEQLREIPSC